MSRKKKSMALSIAGVAGSANDFFNENLIAFDCELFDWDLLRVLHIASYIDARLKKQ